MTNESNETEAIRNLQTYLRQLSYDDSRITPPPVDGIYGSDTRRALSEFQSTHGLPVTGVADQATWEQLYSAYRASLAENALPVKVALFPSLPPDVRLSTGSRGFAVAAVQYMLQELEVQYGILRPIPVTGIYDEITRDAVAGFQTQNVMEPTGEVGRATWNEIADQFNLMQEGLPRQ